MQREVSTRDRYNLDSIERTKLNVRARRGDAVAAIKLAEFQSFYKRDRIGAQAYYRMAAENGDRTAMNNYALGQMMNVAFPAIQEAIKWLDRAEKAGQEDRLLLLLKRRAERVQAAFSDPLDPAER